MAKLDALTISINGRLDPSLIAAINRAETQLKSLGASARTQSAAMSRIYRDAFDGADKAVHKTEELNAAMRRVSEIATGVFSGEILFEGLEKVTEMVERMGEALKEFAVSSLEVRATREVLQNQQKAMLESQGKSGLGPQIDTLIRNMEGRETMIRYDQLMATTNLLMASAPQRFPSVDSIHKMLGALSDVSKSPATFDLASQAFTRILAEGKVDARHLQEMSIDTGFAFKEAMARALKVSPEELTDMMAKHKLTGVQSIDALMKAFDIITGPGGSAYRHAEAQLKGLMGIWARFQGHWADFQESFGKQLENFISPIAEKVFALFTPAELTHAFDQFEDMAKEWGERVSDLFAGIASYMQTVGGPDVLRHLQGVGDAFGQIFKHLTGGFDVDTMFDEVKIPGQDPRFPGEDIVRVMNARGDAWVKSFTVGIDSALDKIKEFGTRLDALMTRIAPLINIFNVINDHIIRPIDDFLYGRMLPFFMDKMWAALDRLQDKLHEMFPWLVSASSGKTASADKAERLKHWAPPDISTLPYDNISGLLAPNTDALKNQTDASEKLRQAIEDATGGWLPSGGSSGVGNFGANYGLHGGLSDNPNETYYEHPDTEGHSSQYGPEGNKLGYGYGVGLGVAQQAKGHPLGSWVKIRTPNGRILWRQVNETSSRPHGIEFVTPHTDESSMGSGKSEIIDSSPTRPDDSTIEEREKTQKPAGVTMNFHIHAIDSDSFASTVQKHAEVIANHVHRVLQSDWERSAVI